jgi:hypothetical protein
MMRERVDGPSSRAEVEAMIREQEQFEEDALAHGRLTLFELCALRFLPIRQPGVMTLPLFDGSTMAPSGRRVGRRRGRSGQDQP